jgi:hypothetical protein
MTLITFISLTLKFIANPHILSAFFGLIHRILQ